MIKYVMAATALKLFSISPQTKQLYRLLGNTLGQKWRIRSGLDKHYVDRAKRTLELSEKYDIIHQGDKLLEIGTGWIHWDSTIIRLYYDVDIVLFDIWDNRHLEAYQHLFQVFEQIIDKEIDMDPAQLERVHGLLRGILQASSFDAIYNLLGFRYIINPAGTLKQFQDESFDVVFSFNVLEHVDRGILPEFIQDIHRVLKPGGYSIQLIDPGDHLAYYDRSVSRKNYLRYSDKIWRRYFENDLQYFNRVQRPEWLEHFHKAGFELLEEDTKSSEIGPIRFDKSYQNLDRQDLECIGMLVVHRKPGTD